ncbi:hypothetical protein FSP39_023493 [Pinctada imbricata]|uniref:Uncharacterized protein n=1 Tax=Pinctada imbricata TaxID=66713 RepID=A0AA88XUC4_PINIB|nr:hypothetical protein FSP39_023493 [Pinctada imbricata]
MVWWTFSPVATQRNPRGRPKQLAENVFLALESPSTFMDDYFYGYHRYVNHLLEPPKSDLTSDVTKVTIRRCNSGRKSKLGPELSVQDDGTEECKALFERIKSDIVKTLFDENDEEDTHETKNADNTPKQTTGESGVRNHGDVFEVKTLGTLKSPNDEQSESDRKKASDSDKDLAGFTNLSDIKHNPKRWSEKCWTRRREIVNKRDVNKDAQQRQILSSKEEATIEANPTDRKETIDSA